MNVHDAIYCYKKSENAYFNNVHIEYSENYINSHYKKDANGRLYTDVSLVQEGQGEARNFNGKNIEPPVGMHWAWSQENIDKAFADGRIIFNSKGTPQKKKY